MEVQIVAKVVCFFVEVGLVLVAAKQNAVGLFVLRLLDHIVVLVDVLRVELHKHRVRDLDLPERHVQHVRGVEDVPHFHVDLLLPPIHDDLVS